MLIFLIILAIFAYFVYWNLYAKRKNLPPGPIPLPIVGNIFQLDFDNLHIDLLKWKKKYGGVFTIWLPEPLIIVSDFNTLKEYFVKQGELFAGRPRMNTMDDFIGGQYGLILNNNAWYKSQRRYALHVLRNFGFGRPILEVTQISEFCLIFKSTIIDQAKKMIQVLEEKRSEPIDLAPYFTNVIMNVIFQLIFGHTKKFDDPIIYMLKHNLDAVNGVFVSPIGFLVEKSFKFKVLDPLFGWQYKDALAKNDEILNYYTKEIEEHKMTVDYESEPRDFIDAYLQEMKKREKEGNVDEFTEHQLLITIFDLVVAGFEAVLTSSRNFILLMLHHPEIQTKIHAELDSVIGREKHITMVDQARLPYLTAAIQELQRITVVLSINFQRELLGDVQMGKYKYPRGTIFIPQFNSVHLDEDVFPDPERFIPERHIYENGAFKKDDRIMPFSIGKRSCLGESLAKMELFLFLSHLLQKFEFQPEIPGNPPPFKYDAGFVRAPKPFKCLAVPRK